MHGPRLYGVGVGPGAPDLLTLRAARILRSVPVMALPRRSEREDSVAGCIAIESVGEIVGQERLPLIFPATADLALRRAARDVAAREISKRLRQGLEVAFVTEGDPLLYSSFLDLLAEVPRHFPGVAVEIVPGVTSVTAVAAAARVPLADGNDRVAILPASQALAHIPRLAREFDSVVLLKVGAVLPALIDALRGAGILGRALLVNDATTPRERVVRDLDALSVSDAGNYSTMLILRERGENDS
ncbi:MAG TPA: precorrin-2 C(20)-methyltransferase [Anaeromyxobacteraceae bacterium]|nr:precorrin-2 C(20)-methyltransferase [Anaeromyxobacteraceae bacterium]